MGFCTKGQLFFKEKTGVSVVCMCVCVFFAVFVENHPMRHSKLQRIGTGTVYK